MNGTRLSLGGPAGRTDAAQEGWARSESGPMDTVVDDPSAAAVIRTVAGRRVRTEDLANFVRQAPTT